MMEIITPVVKKPVKKTRALSAQDFAVMDEDGEAKLKAEVEANGENYSDYTAHMLRMMPREVSPKEIKWRVRK